MLAQVVGEKPIGQSFLQHVFSSFICPPVHKTRRGLPAELCQQLGAAPQQPAGHLWAPLGLATHPAVVPRRSLWTDGRWFS